MTRLASVAMPTTPAAFATFTCSDMRLHLERNTKLTEISGNFIRKPLVRKGFFS
jgi:hypothetical protein